MANFGQNNLYPAAQESGFGGGVVAQMKANQFPGVLDLAAPTSGPQANGTLPTNGPPSAMPTLPPALATPTGGGTPTGGTPAPSPTAPASPAPATPSPATPATPPLSYDQAFNNFKDFIGYDFAFDEAMRALNHGYAASGQLQSGAAAKGIAEYAANLAQQGAAFPYLNYLTGQQNMGVTAGGAIAGVGTNFGSAAQGAGAGYADSASAINNGMGNAIGSGAANLGNLALANGQNQANMWNQVGGALGNLGSSFFPTPGG